MLLPLLAGAFALGGCRSTTPGSLATHDPAKWEGAIAAVETQDLTNRHAPGGIVFTGSSCIRRWTHLAADVPGLPVVNRGFGGCQLADVYHYADRRVIPYAPREVVITAGGNDVNAKKPPRVVFGDFVGLMSKLRAALPDAQWVFISCPPSPKRWEQTPQIREVTSRIAACCRRHEITFVNTFDLMPGPDGVPRPDLYDTDQLHVNEAGYALWREALAPHLKGTP